MKREYESVIGLEVHVQLKTTSKMFCSCSTDFNAPPNSNTCPVCLGLPGALPVLNEGVLKGAIRVGLALNCSINLYSTFDRKNYFYPDLPRGYQISQYGQPLCISGCLEISPDCRVGIRRIHLEDDAGRLVHGAGDELFIDYNRAGMPLIEIVTEPHISTPQEARLFLEELKAILEYLQVSDCNMEEGSLRCDANISLRLSKTEALGEKVELKNMNSFRAIERALEFEINRQAELLKEGKVIYQETRSWDEDLKRTKLMRRKEEAQDYRYFPEPDLPPLKMTQELVDDLKKSLPELPRERRERFIKEFKLPDYDVSILTGDRDLADFFEEAAQRTSPKEVSNWLMGELLRYLNEENITMKDIPLKPGQLVELIELTERGELSSSMAKDVFKEMCKEGKCPGDVMEEKGLKQISDREHLENIVLEILEKNPGPVEDYKEGKKKALGFLIGQVMKRTQGKANPQIVNELMIERLGREIDN